MFRNREEAARLLARRFDGRELRDPLVLAIPRGGVVTGAVLAHDLGTDLDVVLSRKLRAPFQPELAIGAISEDGRIYINPTVKERLDLEEEYINSETAYQLGEIARRTALFRAVRPPGHSRAGR
jgi:predicted phosphoribosyltransferase